MHTFGLSTTVPALAMAETFTTRAEALGATTPFFCRCVGEEGQASVRGQDNQPVIVKIDQR